MDLASAKTAAEIFQLIAGPVILVVIGHIINVKLSSEKLAREYIDMAIGILRQPGNNPRLQSWALEVFRKYSPVKIKDDEQVSLIARSLPALAVRDGRGESAQAPDSGLVVTPDSKRLVSRDRDGSIRVWDLETGKEIARLVP